MQNMRPKTLQSQETVKAASRHSTSKYNLTSRSYMWVVEYCPIEIIPSENCKWDRIRGNENTKEQTKLLDMLYVSSGPLLEDVGWLWSGVLMFKNEKGFRIQLAGVDCLFVGFELCWVLIQGGMCGCVSEYECGKWMMLLLACCCCCGGDCSVSWMVDVIAGWSHLHLRLCCMDV